MDGAAAGVWDELHISAVCKVLVSLECIPAAQKPRHAEVQEGHLDLHRDRRIGRRRDA